MPPAIDKRFLKEIQNNFPVTQRPFLELGKKLSMSEEEVISTLKQYRKKRVLRYVGAVFDSKMLGVRSSLIGMEVPRTRINKVSAVINSFPQISHNYLRDSKYNMWFTVSSSGEKKLAALIKDIKRKTRVIDLLDLPTRRVFKIDARFDLGVKKTSSVKKEKKRILMPGFDKRFVIELNKPVRLISRPFVQIAKRLGLSEEEVIRSLKRYKDAGLLRRFGAILDHNRVGFKTNALVVWKIPQKSLKSSVAVFRRAPQISHCYQRKAYKNWPYNIYTMLHCSDKKTCLRLVDEISGMIGADDLKILFTKKELKKTKIDLKEVI